jgi:hypothetical protein
VSASSLAGPVQDRPTTVASRIVTVRGRLPSERLHRGGAGFHGCGLLAAVEPSRCGYWSFMTDEEHLENTVPEPGQDDESFDVYLPVTAAMDASGATHVAHMRGNEAGFIDVLAGFVATGSDLSARLRSPVDDVDELRFALEGLGPARVESIDALWTGDRRWSGRRCSGAERALRNLHPVRSVSVANVGEHLENPTVGVRRFVESELEEDRRDGRLREWARHSWAITTRMADDRDDSPLDDEVSAKCADADLAMPSVDAASRSAWSPATTTRLASCTQTAAARWTAS